MLVLAHHLLVSEGGYASGSFLIDEERPFQQELLRGLSVSIKLKGVTFMSQSPVLCFPNGHTIEQVKRNAKRLSKEEGIPLNKALDQMASPALGFSEGTIRWAEAVKTLDLTANYYCLPNDFAVPQESRKAFTDGVIVSIDVKDAQKFTNTGPWILDEELLVLISPALIAMSALACAEEDGRKIPNQEDWGYSQDFLMSATIYRHNGSSPFNDVLDVVRDVCGRNFFPPDNVWMGGQLIEIPNHITL